jgi:hypothetical protein
MMISLYKNATTMPGIHQQLSGSDEPASVLALRYGGLPPSVSMTIPVLSGKKVGTQPKICEKFINIILLCE